MVTRVLLPSEENDYTGLWHVRHEDGDEEDLDEKELNIAKEDMERYRLKESCVRKEETVLRLNGGARPRRIIIDSDGDYDDEDDNGDEEDCVNESVQFIDLVNLDDKEKEEEGKEGVEGRGSLLLSIYHAAVKERDAWFAAIDGLNLPGNPLDILIDELV